MFEDVIAFILGGGISFFLIVRPLYGFLKSVTPQRKDSLKEAKERLEIARQEAEAARLNKQTEELYEKMYKETLEDQSSEDEINNKRSSK